MPEGHTFWQNGPKKTGALDEAILAFTELSYCRSGAKLMGPPKHKTASSLQDHDALRFYEFARKSCETDEEKAKFDFSAAWSEKDFALRVRGSENVTALKAIYAAFKKKKIIVGLKPAESWLGAGLLFALESAFTKEAKAEILEADKSEERLQKAFKKTGIEKILKKAGCDYYALSPRWKEGETEIRFWLNPSQQDSNNYGWFKLADLEAWAKGTGPIPKGTDS